MIRSTLGYILKSELCVPVLPAFEQLFSAYRGEQCRATEVSIAAAVLIA